jgi:hypothetical protein
MPKRVMEHIRPNMLHVLVPLGNIPTLGQEGHKLGSVCKGVVTHTLRPASCENNEC